MYTITIDCGTSFLKAALVEYETGKIIKKITKRTSEIETKNRFPRIQGAACIFRKNRALAPHERSAVPLGTDHCPVG